MGRKIWIGLVLALLASAAFAAGPGAVRKQVEASMLVTGDVLIELDGSVSGWEIDQREKLPSPVADLIEKSAPVWKFEPVVIDGQPRKAKARMSLRIGANPLDDGNYRIAIRSGYFGEEAMSPTERQERAETSHLRKNDMRPPAYPFQAVDAGVQGTVYVVVRINRQGAVEEAFAEQVNLRTIGSERQMERMRTMLTNPALAAARKWTFHVPITGEQADNEYWSVRVPVEYQFTDVKKPTYGQWETYIPGLRHHVPWVGGDSDSNESPDAMVAGGIYQVGKGIRLLTPLDQG